MKNSKMRIDYLIQFWWLLLGILFLIVCRGKIGFQSMDKAVFLFCTWCIFFTFIRLGFSALRNATPKIISNPVHTTTTGRWMPLGNYAVFRMGGIRAGGIEWEMNEGTIITPRDAVNIVGDHITLLTRLEEVDISELPSDVRSLCPQMGWKPPYNLGLADEIQELKKPEVIFLETEIKNLNKAIDERDKIISSMTRILEDTMSAQSRIALLGKRSSILDKFKSSMTKEEDTF